MTCLKQLYNLLRDRIAARRLRSSVRSSRIYGEIIMFHHVTDEYVDIQISCRCPIKVFEHYLDDYRNEDSVLCQWMRHTKSSPTSRTIRPFV